MFLKNICASRSNARKSTRAHQTRKYVSFTTSQTSWSFWASVPTKTRKIASANRTTVRRSEARAESARTITCWGEVRTVSAGRSRSRASGCKSSLVAIGYSAVGSEADRIQEFLEMWFFGRDELGISKHLDEPDAAGVRNHRSERRPIDLRLLALCGVGNSSCIRGILAADLDRLSDLGEALLVDGRESDFAAPAVHVFERVSDHRAGVGGELNYGDERLLVAVGDAEGGFAHAFGREDLPGFGDVEARLGWLRRVGLVG